MGGRIIYHNMIFFISSYTLDNTIHQSIRNPPHCIFSDMKSRSLQGTRPSRASSSVRMHHRWTRDSARLQRFVRSHLQNISTARVAGRGSRPCFHGSIAQQLLEQTAAWAAEPPVHTQSERCASIPSLQLRHPSRLHVLRELIRQRAPILSVVLSKSRTAWTPDQLRVRIEAGDLNWFHAHAPRLLHEMGQPYAVQSFRTIAPDVQWCCDAWQRHPDLYGYFVPLDVQQRAERHIRCTQVRQWRWAGRDFALHVLVPHISVRPEILDQMAYRISLTACLGVHGCRRMVLRWFPSDSRKSARTSSCESASSGSCAHCWTPLHINTAATYPNTCNTITIWRSEESYKTSTHEMMHALGWDFDEREYPEAGAAVRRHFAVAPQIEIRFFEGYVETWATLINVYCIAAQRATRSNVLIHREIERMVRAEALFALFQTAKALHYSGFVAWSDFFTNEEGGGNDRARVRGKPTPRFSQKTSVFSYFVVRAAHLWDVAWFVRTFPRPDFAQRRRARASWTAWWKQLLSVWGSPDFGASIDHCLALHRTHDALRCDGGDAATTATASPYSTMRMTLHEVV